MAVSADSNSRWCDLDPRRGTALVVAEAALNLACVGARPLALVDNLNFGNPEHPEVMWQLSEAIDGMAEACLALSLPVVGGNVSLYNESGGRDIHPTPVVGMVGLIDVLDRRPPGVRLVDGGRDPPAGRGRPRPPPASPDPAGPPTGAIAAASCPPSTSRPTPGCARSSGAWSRDDLLAGVHDVSDGGLAVALAEMAIASGVGFQVVGRRRPRRPVLRGAVPGRGSAWPTARRGRGRRRGPPRPGWPWSSGWGRRAATGSSSTASSTSPSTEVTDCLAGRPAGEAGGGRWAKVRGRWDRWPGRPPG